MAPNLSPDTKLDWLRLIRSENVGPRTFRTLINHYGGASRALAALPDLARRGGAARPVPVATREDAEREIAAAERLGVAFIGIGEADYPAQLQRIDDAPPLIAVRGKTAVLKAPTVAMVGSRNASAAGVKVTERLARDLGDAGLVVASGLARGIDAAAHRASLATGSIAVMAGGHDCVYPPEHAPLLDALIAAGGAAISEMPLGWEPRGRDFPRRNRLISGISFGVVVVEAARKSGSLITAQLALEQNREVFAVPGSPLDPRSEGTNALIKQGAVLVTQAEDVLEVLRPITGRGPMRTAEEPSDGAPAPTDELTTPARAGIVALLGPTPVAIDDLIRLSGASPAVVHTALLELDLAGRLKRQRGGLVALL
jgi:DNA processing protein